ncbi:MAG: tRNA (guanosine(37)-N1)-methyltransferase TrmD [Candidatus Taylorbacteria bacterium]|nr:tRNA (guanosine(37)-N1)-methyltransferase TrmD [Candidatus Taylorbacteria bacterium]
MVTFHVVTLFPESLDSYLNASIVKRARENGQIMVKFYNPRDFVVPKKGKGNNDEKVLTYADRRVDDRPYGGGPGMVIEALPVIKAIEKAVGRKMRVAISRKKVQIVFFNPGGVAFSTGIADRLKKFIDIVLVCGRYEGIDARIKKAFPMVDISIGEYTLTGGELPAMVLIDAITRRLPGVLGDDLSVEESRIASHDVYTRPEAFEYKGIKYRVPKILLTGHHKNIDEWKLKGKNIGKK